MSIQEPSQAQEPRNGTGLSDYLFRALHRTKILLSIVFSLSCSVYAILKAWHSIDQDVVHMLGCTASAGPGHALPPPPA